MDISGLIPGLVSTFILLSYSDRQGRKFPLILSSVGALASSVWLCLLSYFNFPFQLLIASTFLFALCGNSTTFLGAGFAYIVDQCKEQKQRTIRIAIIDFLLGLVTGLTGLSSGYFIRELGFVWSFLIITMALTVNLIYILFFLDDSVKEFSSQNVSMSCSEGFKNLFYQTYRLFKNASGNRRSLLCLLLFTMVTYFFVIIGISPIFILYELDSPLCWNEVFIGYGSALGSISFLSSFLGIWFFSYCMEDIQMALIGIFTTMAGMVMTAFAKTTLMMFLVRLPFLFTIVPLSVLRSMMSKVVDSTEQGEFDLLKEYNGSTVCTHSNLRTIMFDSSEYSTTLSLHRTPFELVASTLFACIAFLETLGGVTAVSAFNGIYAATVAWYPGFAFLLSAGLLLMPVISLCVVRCIGWKEGSYVLLIQEESREDTSDR
ncbi:hypothetical protein MC885_001665 [Smutsia gigantea]|nr:hypothetical protein MC885_001665 [Smutsia gigantea]